MNEAAILQYLTQAGFAGLAIFLVFSNQKREERTLTILDKYAESLTKITSALERVQDCMVRIETRIPQDAAKWE
jgi:hypothetical protein